MHNSYSLRCKSSDPRPLLDALSGTHEMAIPRDQLRRRKNAVQAAAAVRPPERRKRMAPMHQH